MKTIRVGMLGLGAVGCGVWKILTDKSALLKDRTGFQFVIKKILVRNTGKRRSVEVPQEILTTRAEEVLDDPTLDVIIEVMGGVRGTDQWVRRALERGKPVVTANKALLAERGGEIFRWAREHRAFIGFEASVAGGIPILKAVREGFVGNRIEAIYGIINGTSNYILSAMSEEGKDFSEVLEEAKRRGYAEQDPQMDIDGRDAAQKLAILISVCTGLEPPLKEIFVEGIGRLTPFDIESARRLGFAIKLLAIYKQREEGIEARVHPTLIPKSHPLAEVRGVFNAIWLKGDAIGDAMFYGRGAGMMPTASAVVSDLVAAAEAQGSGRAVPLVEGLRGSFLPIASLEAEYYLRFSVIDRPGVLAEIASHLGKNEISIASVHQYEQDKGSKVPIVVMTHVARQESVDRAIGAVDRLETVLDRTLAIRVDRL